MSIQHNYELISDLTFTLDTANQEVYVKLSGVPAVSVISVQILDTGAKCIIQSCIDSSEYMDLSDTTHSSCLWENIRVDGVEITEVVDNIYSTYFISPNFLYIKNTSATDLRVKISLRGNR